MEMVSMSAIAKGRTLDEVALEVCKSAYDGVEIAIGPRPVDDPWQVVRFLRGSGKYVTAHHSVPLGKGRILRPSSYANAGEIAKVCYVFGIMRYSCHPPLIEGIVDSNDLVEWYVKMENIFDKMGIVFSVETMYPERRGRWLTGGGSTLEFVDRIKRRLPNAKPLIIDLGHIYIGYNQGSWSDQQVDALLHMGGDIASEIHYSANDGVRDMHRKLYDQDLVVAGWLQNIRSTANHLLFVDESRR
jgi:sugar phosphate isomerase/epimerase